MAQAGVIIQQRDTGETGITRRSESQKGTEETGITRRSGLRKDTAADRNKQADGSRYE